MPAARSVLVFPRIHVSNAGGLDNVLRARPFSLFRRSEPQCRSIFGAGSAPGSSAALLLILLLLRRLARTL